jgi:DNA-directed RNA polymerase subunit alpha
MNNLLFETKEEEKKENYGRFAISPLEKGYGYTLGNSLRRVLLESLGGVAITSVEIKGVKHQFSTLQGMKEDVVEFLLNLKKVRFSLNGELKKTEKVKLSAKGPGEVKAGDIQVSGVLKVANPDHVLAYLNKGAKLEAEMTVEYGYGYRLVDSGSGKIGLILLDAIFSPVTRVSYRVEETRVGKLTNYDKLVLEIWTDGSIEPKQALIEAAKILRSHYDQIISPRLPEKTAVEEKKTDSLGAIGKLSVEEIGLPTRVANALIKAGYETVESLAKAKKEDLAKVRNLGEKSVKIVKLALAEKGVKFLEE